MIDVPPAHLYIGEGLDPKSRKRDGNPVMLDSADLTTHGVIVGMTGSGKTGLGVDLLEDTLLQGIPTLLIDPKGDLGNLLLAFPELRPDDFAPWVEQGDPAQVAEQWRAGLADWGIDPERIKALKDAADFTIYTPGSTAGVPLNLVGLQRPAEGTASEVVADEVQGYVTGLLKMVGIDADPLSSRESILLTNLIESAWSNGQDLDLAALVGLVQNPPLKKLGVYELESFYPAKERSKLAMTLNGLLASPSFGAWTQGTVVDMDTLLKSQDGKPRCAIVNLSQLDDNERQFVVALLLGKLITWMRRQAGTDKLRALVYFDEVLGFVPPTAAPPAKQLILTLFKQARAFGVGMVLATQNPVDVDYKGLSNAGTWMIGRLQTEQDKGRLLDGLSSAGGEVDVKAAGEAISSLGKREFMLRRAGSSSPSLMTSRWAMSYLRGPLTRDQIHSLMADQIGSGPGNERSDAQSQGQNEAADQGEETSVAPQVADGVTVQWLDSRAPWAGDVGADSGGTRLAPAVLAQVSILFEDRKSDLREQQDQTLAYFPLTASFDASVGKVVTADDRDFASGEPADAKYVLSDAPIQQAKYFTAAKKAITDYLYSNETYELLSNSELKLPAEAGESADAFAARCESAASEKAEAEKAALRDKYANRLERARDAVAAAKDRVTTAQATASTRKTGALANLASSVLGGLFGGRRRNPASMARGVGQALGGAGRSREASRRVDAAEGQVQRKQEAVDSLQQELDDKLTAVDDEWADKAKAVETVSIRPDKSDITVGSLTLVWLPVS